MTSAGGFPDLTGARVLVVAKAAGVGFKGYFRKPVNLERLCVTLAALRRGEPVAGDNDRYD